jgi:hypothetical protein
MLMAAPALPPCPLGYLSRHHDYFEKTNQKPKSNEVIVCLARS